MKKTHATIAIFLWLIALTTSAQNMYRNYQSSPNAVPRPTSAVSIVHSNQNVYFFQADEYGKLSVTEIDPLSLNPTGNETCFQLTLQNQSVFEFYLNGGFENSIGDFVLFGYFHNYISSYSFFPCPVYIIIPSNFASCDSYCLTTEGKYVAGCSGYNQVGQEVYVLVNEDGDLIAANAATPNLPNRITLAVGSSVYQDRYTDISWDGDNKHFIASGSAWNSPSGHEDPFVHIFDLIFNNNSYTTYSIAEYYIDNLLHDFASEHRSLHVQLDSNNLLLYHDLRYVSNSSSYDIIWMTRIKNFYNVNTATIDESWFYNLHDNKLFEKDMLYDPYNKRLNFLGYYNNCREGLTQLLAQVDPYNLHFGIEIGQLGATFPGAGHCDTIAPNFFTLYNDLMMSNLALNTKNPCHPVLIAGVGNKMSILTETYDISLSKCDIPMWHKDYKANPVLNPYYLNNTYPLCPSLIGSHIPLGETINDSILCDEDGACSHQFGNKSMQQFIVNSGATTEITFVANNFFICDGFEGDIQYFIYDVAGKLLQQGVTQNRERNKMIKSKGLCLLKATDATGTQVVKKVVLL